jgi:hypothetical protein
MKHIESLVDLGLFNPALGLGRSWGDTHMSNDVDASALAGLRYVPPPALNPEP